MRSNTMVGVVPYMMVVFVLIKHVKFWPARKMEQ